MRARIRCATAAVVTVMALSTATATATPSPAQPTAVSPTTVTPPAELRYEAERQRAILESTGVTEGSEEWGFLVAAAGRALIAAARAAGPAVYRALVSAVRSGYASFNSWCSSNFLCGAAAGVGLAEVWEWLKDNI